MPGTDSHERDDPPPGWQLRELAEGGEGRVWPLGAQRITLGRDRACEVELRSPYLARRHALLLWAPDRNSWIVESSGGGHACTVNGWAFVDTCPLVPGDVLRLGDVELRLERLEAQLEPSSREERFTLLGLLHQGALFETWRAKARGRPVCVKRSRDGTSPSHPATEAEAFQADWSVCFSRLDSLIAHAGCELPVAPTEALLASEAECVRASAGAWNHHLLDEVIGAGGRRSLVFPLHEGEPLRSVNARSRRRVLPRLLPDLWDALAAAPHGDVQPGNLIVKPGGDAFHLIDPCASVVRIKRVHAIDGRQDLLFTTSPRYYPFLPPYHRARLALADGPSLAEHLDDYLAGLSRVSFESAIEEQTTAIAFHTRPAGIGEKACPEEPHPGDLQALGILYYEALTGRHPFFEDAFPAPSWLGGKAWDHVPKGFERALARVARPVESPSTIQSGISPAEDALALSLVELEVPHREALAQLVAGVRC